jgi:hypothetical protein
MKAIATLTAAAAVLALAGCDRLGIGGGGDSANLSANAAANASDASKDPASNQAAAAGSKDPAADGAAPAAAGGVRLDRAYVAGRWTDNGDCSVAVDFAEDGRFTANNGAGGLWNLEGDRLTMSGSSTLTLQIVPIDQNTMNVVNPDGSLGRSTRC